jgi:RNA polymerase sigma-54 factor
MNEKLAINQTQKTLQHLAPQQVMFVKMLEMSTPEFEDEVRRVVDENPALEARDGDSESYDSPSEALTDNGDAYTESAEDMQRADYRDEDDIPFYRINQQRQQSDDDDAFMTMDRNAATESLAESLIAQLREFVMSQSVLTAATYIIGNLDANGRMTRSLAAIADDIAITTGVEIAPADMMQAFEIVRGLEPPGVATFDLQDCLLIQLKRREPKTLALRVATDMIEHHFDLFAKKHFDKISSRLGVSLESVREAVEVVKTLNPKPGNASESDRRDQMRHITPDFVVEAQENGRFSVSLTQRLPELAIEESFVVGDNVRPMSKREAEGLAFVKRKNDEARAFIDLIRRRNDTLMAVMKAIVSLQPEFFATGEQSRIRPMILRDIAALTDLDLSVISRAAGGKYVATGTGVYPLKMFLNERPNDESDVSSHEILDTLKDIIDNEDSAKPLSDEAIRAVMQERGFDLARRTVTKYRERLNIPVARLRKGH